MSFSLDILERQADKYERFAAVYEASEPDAELDSDYLSFAEIEKALED
jgi:hypothetical protein